VRAIECGEKDSAGLEWDVGLARVVHESLVRETWDISDRYKSPITVISQDDVMFVSPEGDFSENLDYISVEEFNSLLWGGLLLLRRLWWWPNISTTSNDYSEDDGDAKRPYCEGNLSHVFLLSLRTFSEIRVGGGF